MDSLLHYSIEKASGVVTLKLVGKIVYNSSKIFQEALDEIRTLRNTRVMMDLSELEFICSLGIGKLLIFNRDIVAANSSIEINPISETVLRIFESVEIDKLFEIKVGES